MIVKGAGGSYFTSKPIVWRAEIGIISVPVGYSFESSVPRLFRPLWSPDRPDYLLAAAIHDYMLEYDYDTAVADREWRKAALMAGAPWLRTTIGYMAMRVAHLRS